MNNVTTIMYENFSVNETVEPYVRPFDEIGIIISAFILISFFVIGLVGNTLTIAVILSYNTLSSSIFMRMILSLCASDLLSALISWLFLYRRTWGFDDWALPGIFCKFYWGADIMTSYATALHILSFAVLRFVSIKFPIQQAKVTMRHINIVIALIWLVCFLCGFLPFFLWFNAFPRDRFATTPDARWPACTLTIKYLGIYQIYQLVAYPIFLLLPLILIIVLGIFIAWVVKVKSAKAPVSKKCAKRQRKEKQAVIQLVLIVVAFIIGYLPFTVYEFWAIAKVYPNTQYYRIVDYWLGMGQYYFLRLSECLNPLFYNLGSSMMRAYTMKFIKTKLLCCSVKQTKPRKISASTVTTVSGRNFGV